MKLFINLHPEDSEQTFQQEVVLCNKCKAITADIKGHLEWHLSVEKRSWGRN